MAGIFVNKKTQQKPSNVEAGDRDVIFAKLLDEYRRSILAYIYLLTGDKHATDDIFQETSITLWSKIDEFTFGTNFRAWACQIAYNKTRFYHRKQASQSVRFFSDQFLERVADTVAKDEEKKNHKVALLRKCIEKLSPKSRDLINYQYETPKRTAKDVAKKFGRSVDSTYRVMRQIRSWLFECIQNTMERGEGVEK